VVRIKARPRLRVECARGYARVCEQSTPAVFLARKRIRTVTPAGTAPGPPARPDTRIFAAGSTGGSGRARMAAARLRGGAGPQVSASSAGVRDNAA
jgi:hypothetical protein